MVLEIDSHALREQLLPLLAEHPGGALVFDADGTLWSHDVGSTVFTYACQEDALHPEARELLLDEARKHGISVPHQASTEELGQTLHAAYLSGRYDEYDAAVMQVWIYVHFTETELRELTHRALTRRGHLDRLHREVNQIAEWARAQGAHTYVVSASPRTIIEVATRELGFDASSVTGGVPLHDAGRIRPGLAEPLPYGPGKVTAGRRLLGERPWLAAFGDSDFDLDMLRAARLGVGIGEKSSLIAGLRDIPRAVRLKNP